MMNSEIVLNQELYIKILLSVSFISLVIFKIGFYYGNRRKVWDGNHGEGLVRKQLTKYCEISTSHVLNNVTLTYGDGTTQIDHILISQNGILVIETKHYTGWLFAHEKQRQWTQVIYRVKNKFQNPIFQNQKHIKAVRQLLDFLPSSYIQGLVVFSGDAHFKTDIPDGVVHIEELISYIDTMRFGTISENRVQFCVGRLECKRLELTQKTDVEHQAYLEQKFGEFQ
ncbi:nuclease-related domain-containing protein [Endozoicomonas atrinae]|uniref:nuclease-related domain-containing protein n=1 Tax=Endozoicomonas atrinae TaxID=1333660 RepID=UPI0008251322|nr:nuclease-related domain-containing protein [Endozoicomonas atrinae]